MDSPFNRQYSLYESVSNRQSSTSLNNLAAKSTSRLGSPSVPSSVLGSDIGRRAMSPKTDKTPLPQNTPSGTWNTGSQVNQSDQPATSGTIGSGSSYKLNGFNAFVSPLSGASQTMGYPYNNSSSSLGYTGYGGTGGYGNVGGQLNTSQYPSQLSGQYASQYGSQYGGQYGNGSQLANPYGQYGNPYGQYGNAGVAGGLYTGSNLALDSTSSRPDLGASEYGSATTRDATPIGTKPKLGPEGASSGSAHSGGSVGDSANVSIATSPESGSQEEAFVPPANLFWNYIDLQGQIQGPFSSVQMNEWLAYMMDVTLIRRVNDTYFVSFGLLKEVTGSNEPFIVLLSASAWNSVMRKAAELMNENQQAESHDYQKPQFSSESQGATHQPFANAAESENLSARAPASRESSLAPGDNVIPSLAAMKVSESQQGSLGETSKEENASNAAAATAAAATAAAVAAHKNSTSEKLAGTSQEPPSDATQAASAHAFKAEPARVPVSDPWKKTSKPSTQISIADLKQLELEKQQQKKKSPETPSPTVASRKNSQGRWVPIEQIQSPVESAPSPSSVSFGASPTSNPGATWGKKAVGATRSLADIQKEQALKSKQANPNSMASMVASPTAGGSKPAPKTGNQPRNEAASPKGRFQSLDETSRTAAGPAAQVPKPRVQRPVQQSTIPTSVTANASKARLTDELVHWARVSFKDLHKGIDAIELLEVFLSLPSNNNAKEFISESIYSYSKTLDGRRFASDFLSRKKTAEASMAPGETWQDVLNRFNPNANVVEQDPSFKVVTKKRPQKIARPGDSMHI